MGYFEIGMIGVGLAMDAFAAAICKGLSLRRLSVRSMVLVGVCFGSFQAGMPMIGYLLGRQFEETIAQVDHWAAFAMLSFIGGKMILDGMRPDYNEELTGRSMGKAGRSMRRADRSAGQGSSQEGLAVRELLTLAVATSIDAMAVGISFAFLKVEILPAAGIIGLITLVLASSGVKLGYHFGATYKEKATLAGGLILILMGMRILGDHFISCG